MHFSTLVDIIILALFLGMAIVMVGMLAYTRKLVQQNDMLQTHLDYMQNVQESMGGGPF